MNNHLKLKIRPTHFTHAVGVSLQLRGEIVPNNSLFNLDDLQYHTDNNQPTNANGQQTLMCVTDLKDCCDTEQLGNWYYPDGRTVVYNTGGATFQRNRGQNETIGSQNFYGSVRLWRRYTPTERGLFRCELQDAENVVQNLYVNICEFPMIFYAYCELNACFTQCILPASLVRLLSL